MARTRRQHGAPRRGVAGTNKGGGEADGLLLDDGAVARVQRDADGADELAADLAREDLLAQVGNQRHPQGLGLLGTEHDVAGGRLRALAVEEDEGLLDQVGRHL